MGYTHYWYQKKALTDDQWTHFSEGLQQLHEQLPKTVDAFEQCFGKDWAGSGSYPGDTPLLIELEQALSPQSSPCFYISGQGEPDLGHESAVFYQQSPPNTWATPEEIAENGTFNCCKTARKPYDVFVCASLLLLKSLAPDSIHVSSDGDPQDWAAALRFARFVTQYPFTLDLVFDSADGTAPFKTLEEPTSWELSCSDHQHLDQALPHPLKKRLLPGI